MRFDRSTLQAMIRAVRATCVIVTLVFATSLFVPGLGWRSYFEDRLGRENWLNLVIGWTLLAWLAHHLRANALQSQVSYLARLLQRISPDLKKREAVKILVRALSSDDESVVDTAHRELKRITRAELGRSPEEWQRWLEQEERETRRS
ncbi:MAG: hypothetical protein AB7O52_14925 [Planctomycetota bacterium]